MINSRNLFAQDNFCRHANCLNHSLNLSPVKHLHHHLNDSQKRQYVNLPKNNNNNENNTKSKNEKNFLEL